MSHGCQQSRVLTVFDGKHGCEPLYCACRPRWRPNQAQISLLEQHFNAGHSKHTQELTAAVQQAGSATEQQVSVNFAFLLPVTCADKLNDCSFCLSFSATQATAFAVQVTVWLKNRLARAKRDAKVGNGVLLAHMG